MPDNGKEYSYNSSGINSQGNHYCSRDYGNDSNSYHYSNKFVFLFSSLLPFPITPLFHYLTSTMRGGPIPFRIPLIMHSNGSYYYSNPNGSTYYNNGSGGSTYTAPSGGNGGSGGSGGKR
ncbi:hypothetical protein BJX70DRAFT_372351 [Aspergillus crustosus]